MKEKQASADAEWTDPGKILHDIQLALSSGWEWYKNPRCKYVDIRIDTRDGMAILLDRDGKRITWEEFARQEF